jgi:hypothetical protein
MSELIWVGVGTGVGDGVGVGEGLGDGEGDCANAGTEPAATESANARAVKAARMSREPAPLSLARDGRNKQRMDAISRRNSARQSRHTLALICP